MIRRVHILEVDTHKFVAEASDLYDVEPAFRTGWPERVQTDLGNGQPLVRVAKRMRGNEIESVRYDQQFGCISLRVYND